MWMMTTHHFGNVKKAIQALGDYYNSAPNDQNPLSPYPSGPLEFTFEYVPIVRAAQLNFHQGKLVF